MPGKALPGRNVGRELILWTGLGVSKMARGTFSKVTQKASELNFC